MATTLAGQQSKHATISTAIRHNQTAAVSK